MPLVLYGIESFLYFGTYTAFCGTGCRRFAFFAATMRFAGQQQKK